MARRTTDHIHIFQMCLNVKNNPSGFSLSRDEIKPLNTPLQLCVNLQWSLGEKGRAGGREKGIL